jgi:hypothetical protein
MGTGGLAT